MNPDLAQTDAAAKPNRSRALPILRRAGAVLIAIGVIDIAIGLFQLANRTPSVNLNIFALVAGIFLWRGGLRTASLVRWIAWALLPVTLFMVIAYFVDQPLDLMLTYVRLAPVASVIAAATAVGYCALLIWIVRELGREPVLAARVAAGRPLRDMRIPLALGVAGAVAAAGFMLYLLGGERAQRAEAMAAAKLGPGYRYHTSSVNIVSNKEGTAVTASVAAWNPQTVAIVPVRWKE